MSGPPTIAPLTEGEIDQAVALWRDVGMVRPWNDPVADIRAALACPTSTVLAACAGGRIVATVMAGYDGHRGWFYYLCVAAEQRGQGVGRAIVEAAELWLRGQGAGTIRLMVRAENEQVVAFYESLGYSRDALIVMGKRFGAS
jgi:ribosomal protein S18 acetylase RimI-like enzyme